MWTPTPIFRGIINRESPLPVCSFHRRTQLILCLSDPQSSSRDDKSVIIDTRRQRQQRVAAFHIHGNLKSGAIPQRQNIGIKILS